MGLDDVRLSKRTIGDAGVVSNIGLIFAVCWRDAFDVDVLNLEVWRGGFLYFLELFPPVASGTRRGEQCIDALAWPAVEPCRLLSFAVPAGNHVPSVIVSAHRLRWGQLDAGTSPSQLWIRGGERWAMLTMVMSRRVSWTDNIYPSQVDSL